MNIRIFAVRKDWSIIQEFKTFNEADQFDEDYFQIIYREGNFGPMHIYKQK